MAIRYKALTELYQETQRSVTAPDQWRAFLASACRNYRLSFYEQLLVYAQRPHSMNNCLSTPSAQTPPPSWRLSDGTGNSGAG